MNRSFLVPLLATAIPFAATATIDPTTLVSPIEIRGETVWRDNRPVRFWGCNVFLQPWTNTQSVDTLADRIASLGFNAVRFWGGPKPLEMTTDYQPGDGSPVDLHDRFQARLKSLGIAVYQTQLTIKAGTPKQPVKFPEESILQMADLVETTPDDRAQWIEAIRENKTESRFFRPLVFIDERLAAWQIEEASTYLDHVNRHTGIRNADENNIIAWDLMNEGMFIPQLVMNNGILPGDGEDGYHSAWHPYFLNKLQTRFNQWLATHYTDNAALSQAWNETVTIGKIPPGVRTASGESYSPAHIADFTHFCSTLSEDWTARYTKSVRSRASSPKSGISVAMIVPDTTHRGGLTNFVQASSGNTYSTGGYPPPQVNSPGGSRWKEHPAYPFEPTLFKTYNRHLEDARPLNQPVIMYEVNLNGFSPYRAEFAWYMAAYAAAQNYTGIFFYHFNQPSEKELNIPLHEIRFAHRGFQFLGHEPYCAALSAAGRAFTSFALPSHKHPTVVSFSKQIATNPAWKALNPGTLPESLKLKGVTREQLQNLADLLSATAYTRGLRIAIHEDQEFDIVVTGPLDPPTKTVNYRGYKTGAKVEGPPGVIWDSKKGRLIVDTPRLKAFIGFNFNSLHQWSDGLAISGAKEDFMAFSLLSLTEDPVIHSSKIYYTSAGACYNEGMKLHTLDQKHAKGEFMTNGEGPLITTHPNPKISFPNRKSRTIEARDFALEELTRRNFDHSFQFPKEMAVFDAQITQEKSKP